MVTHYFDGIPHIPSSFHPCSGQRSESEPRQRGSTTIPRNAKERNRMPPISGLASIRRRPSLPSTGAVALVAMLTVGCRDDIDSNTDPFAYTPLDGNRPRGHDRHRWSDPDYAFGQVFGLEPGPDGLAIPFTGERRRVALDRRRSGWQAPSGRAGLKGPENSSFLIEMGFFGDSLWAWDFRAYRASYFDLDGKFLGSVSPPFEFGSREESPPRPQRPFRDGTFLGSGLALSHLVATGKLTETAVVRMNAQGEQLTLLWKNPHEPRDGLALMDDNGASGTFGSQPFGDDVRHTVSEEGLIVVERRAWTGEGEPVVTLTRIDLAGDTVFQRRIPYTPEPLPAERVDSAIRAIADSWYEDESGITKGALEARIREATYKPAYLPPVVAARVMGDGNIWLERYAPVESDTGERFNEWWILTIDGEPMARERGCRPSSGQVRRPGRSYGGRCATTWMSTIVVRYRLVKGGRGGIYGGV